MDKFYVMFPMYYMTTLTAFISFLFGLSYVFGDEIRQPEFQYHRYSDMKAYMRYLSKASSRCHLYSIGKSIMGRELYVLAVSYEKPDEIIPTRAEVQFVGLLRGNEV